MGAPGPLPSCLGGVAPGPPAQLPRGGVAPGHPGRGRLLLCVEHQSPEVGGPRGFLDARPGSRRLPPDGTALEGGGSGSRQQ